MQDQPLSPPQVERLIGYLRIFGLGAGLVLVTLSDFPGPALRVIAWATLSVLSVATLALWAWGRRSAWDRSGLVHVGFLVDVLLIAGYAVSFAHITPNVSWAVVFTVLADSTIRYGVRGAVLGYLLGAGLLVLQAVVHESVTGERTTALGYTFVLSTLFGVAGVLGLFSHLLRLRAAEQRAQALALSDARELQDRVIASASHEFRSSLTVILGAARIARQKRDRLSGEELVRLLDDIESEGLRVQQLVADQVSGGEDRIGGIPIRPRSGDVADTVRRAAEAADRHRKNHDLVLDVHPLVCTLDHERLQQIVRNLVENALFYTEGGSRVTVSSRRLGVSVEVRVVDNGPGIPAAEQSRVFEPFQRGRSRSPRSDSLGLGLYLVRQIATAMGGVVELRSSSSGSDVAVRVLATDFGDAGDATR